MASSTPALVIEILCRDEQRRREILDELNALPHITVVAHDRYQRVIRIEGGWQ
jgi:hypothetical protein